MDLKISDLFNIRVCQSLYLLTGKNGLKNIVRWFYIVEDPECMKENVKPGDMLIFRTNISRQKMDEVNQILESADEFQVSGIMFFECPMIRQINFDKFCKRTHNHIPVIVLKDNTVPITDITYHIAMGILNQYNLKYGMENFMQELLDGNFGNKITLYSRAEYFHYNLQQPHRVLIFRFCNYVYGDEKVERMVSHIKRICNNFLAGFYNIFMSKMIRGDYIALLPPNGKKRSIEEIAQELFEKIRQEYNTLECYIAVGNAYKEPEEFHISRSDAEQILKISEFLNETNRVTNTFHVMEYLIILNIKDKNIIEKCYHFMEILEDGNENDKTRLIDTLDTFFRCSCNAVMTAKCLFIHRNTLKMRLDKIEETCKVNLRNYEDCFRLKMSMIVYRMKNQGMI